MATKPEKPTAETATTTAKPAEPAEKKPATVAAPIISPEASPSKKRPELRPQTKTPKASEKDKPKDKEKEPHEAPKAAAQPVQNNRGHGKNIARTRPIDLRKDDKRDDRRRDDRGGRRREDNWNGQKKEQRGGDKSDDKNTNSTENNKPLAPVHPLHCNWMFWLCLPQGVATRNDRKAKWESTLKELGSNFNSVEHFWGYVHHIEPPSRMDYSSSYYLFKSGIKPMWEHEDNVGGGKWTVQLKGSNHVDDVWQNIMLAIVGEVFDGLSDAITGAVVNRRRAGDRVAVWIRKSSDEVVADLGEKIKTVATDGLEGVEITCSFSLHNPDGSFPPTETS